MGIETFFVVWVDGKPLSFPMYSWSQGLNSRRNVYYGRGPVVSSEKPVKSLSVEELCSLLQKKGHPESLIARVTKEQIDGAALRYLEDADIDFLSEGLGLGVRRRFSSDVRALQLRLDDEEQDRMEDMGTDMKTQLQDVSVSGYMSSRMVEVVLSHLARQKPLERCAMIGYSGGNTRRNRWGGGENDPMVIEDGNAVAMLEMSKTMVCNLSMSCSSDDRVNISLNLRCERAVYTVTGVQDGPSLKPEMKRRLLGLDENVALDWMDGVQGESNEDERALEGGEEQQPAAGKKKKSSLHGVSLVLEQWKRPQVVEWGKHVIWSKATHAAYPREFKVTVKTLMSLYSTKRDANPVSWLPKDVLLLLFRWISTEYNASPLAQAPPHPNPPAPPAEEGAGDEGNDGGRLFF